MYSISKKINILEQALVVKNHLINDEMIPSVVTKFTCCNCSSENTVEIKPYESGFPILQIYIEDKILSKNELLKNKMVTKTSNRMSHLGPLTVNDLPTLYFGTNCSFCFSKYIYIFSYGEKQPGLTLLEISGVWKYEEVD
ncbi:hypothetical protein [Chryseobacterium sp. ERMR1:04]|uniref:hypothetical protein n=1 Tax=Chryseobacterium sp. ERMR1:04 TaxID=1705393 RepID=UPI0006C84C53|nr:hypothetical protein [Chryseobacterium sp. ERMR1:04]KPH14161.1 hypothetical protein AMQ68_01135 [Chryseobacterium sp. ERMR1:04]